MNALKTTLCLGFFGGMSFGLAACGGFSNLGDGPEGGSAGSDDGGTGGSLGGAAGKGSGGKAGKGGIGTGGSMMPTPGTGGTMNSGTGGTMTPGSGGTITPGTGGTMTPGMGGTGGGMIPTGCAGLTCGSQCLGLDDPAQMGGPGFLGFCTADGSCNREFIACPEPTTCANSMDCPASDAACQMCADGSSACPSVECLMGICVTAVPVCGAYAPCDGLACGAACDPCAPGEMCPQMGPEHMARATCNATGICQYGNADCGLPCMAALDCPSTEQCFMCAGGTCGDMDCVNGRCEFVCPDAPIDSCSADMDCPPPPPFCMMCADGVCAGTSCIEGQCVFGCPPE